MRASAHQCCEMFSWGAFFINTMTENKMIAEHIVSSVCNRFGITRNELRSQSRKAYLVDARQTCALALRKFGCTYEYIGNVINRKDHTNKTQNA